MTSQYDFTNNEWSDIAVLPVLVGYAIARAEDSGRIGSFREIRALVHGIAEKAPDNAATVIIEAASIIDVRGSLADFEDHDAELLGDVAVTSCRKISQMLDVKTKPSEAIGYKNWVFDIAGQVANAAREDGVRVSAGEARLLDRTKAALGL